MLEIESQTDDAEFIKLISSLKAMYGSREIPHIFLTQKLGQRDTPIKISELAELAKEIFIAVHTSTNPNNPLFSPESFRNVALHAVASLRRKLAVLFQQGANKYVHMLLVSDEDVYWSQSPESMK